MDEADAIDMLDEPALWRAVLKRALDDATCTTPRDERGGSGGRPTVAQRDEARRFLLSHVEPWRGDRHRVATFAGFLPEVVEQRSREILIPMMAAEQEAEAAHVESDEDTEARLALAVHLELGGGLHPRERMRTRARRYIATNTPAMAAE